MFALKICSQSGRRDGAYAACCRARWAGGGDAEEASAEDLRAGEGMEATLEGTASADESRCVGEKKGREAARAVMVVKARKVAGLGSGN